MEIVSARIGIRVGVADAGTVMSGVDVKVGRMEGCFVIMAGAVGVDKLSTELGAGKVWTEKLHPSITSELKTRIRTYRKPLRGFIALSFLRAVTETLVGIVNQE
jgi:hypothetical protein